MKLMKYGCWCGPGTIPDNRYPAMDAFDNICKIHDWCWYNSVYKASIRRHCVTNYTGPDWINRFSRLAYYEGYNWHLDAVTKQVMHI